MADENEISGREGLLGSKAISFNQMTRQFIILKNKKKKCPIAIVLTIQRFVSAVATAHNTPHMHDCSMLTDYLMRSRMDVAVDVELNGNFHSQVLQEEF